MEKVLFISSRPLYPIISGIQIRTAQQLEFLTQRYQVDVIYQAEKAGSKEEEQVRQHLPLVGKVLSFKLPKWKSYLKTLNFLFNSLPLQVNYYYDSRIQLYVNQHRDEYSMLFCNNIRTAKYAMKTKGIIRCIDFVDAFSMNYEKARKRARGIWKWIYAIEYKRCSSYEQRVLRAFDHCAVISDIDRQYIVRKSSASLYVVGNKVAIPSSARSACQEEEGNIVFIGKMNYEPNVTAVTYFAERILPKLTARYPQLRFTIVGAAPHVRVRKLAQSSHITVTGYVDEVAPYYQKATLIVSPMLTGAGIQNKIIQAMAYGCCVVTTSLGAEGLDIRHGEIAVADGDENMTATILSLLKDKQKRESMGKAAREYVIEHLSEPVIARQFWSFINHN